MNYLLIERSSNDYIHLTELLTLGDSATLIQHEHIYVSANKLHKYVEL